MENKEKYNAGHAVSAGLFLLGGCAGIGALGIGILGFNLDTANVFRIVCTLAFGISSLIGIMNKPVSDALSYKE